MLNWIQSILPDSEFRVSDDGSFDLSARPTITGPIAKSAAKKALKGVSKELDELQRKLYAQDKFSVLCVFQAMDAAGKDSTIRNVFGPLNPAGCQVFSFKAPSKEELDHDFLWRSAQRLPERGRIGVFNRSYYEETLVVKVHPEYLDAQRLPHNEYDEDFWQARYESISDHEKHLVRNGTVVLKFWLNVSRDEQARRFLSRIDDPAKNWKFSANDLAERALWDDYMAAYQQCIAATSSQYAPWFAIPADNKPAMRLAVATILRDALKALPLSYPELSSNDKGNLAIYAQQLKMEPYV
jgi:PPK2 family polyphosphate:nucleotide phosphotransferase